MIGHSQMHQITPSSNLGQYSNNNYYQEDPLMPHQQHLRMQGGIYSQQMAQQFMPLNMRTTPLTPQEITQMMPYMPTPEVLLTYIDKPKFSYH